MKKLSWLLSVLFMLGLTSSSFSAEELLIGDFEAPGDTSYTPPRYDEWFEDGLTMARVTSPGVTRNTHALRCSTTVGGWGPGIQFPLFRSGSPEAEALEDQLIATATSPEACLVVDYTAFAADFTSSWCQLGITRNTAAPTGGWDKSGWQDMILDGQPHQMIFVISEDTKAAIIAAEGGWGANLGLCLFCDAGNAKVYFDDIWLLPTSPEDEFLPHDGMPVGQTRVGNVETLWLNWQAAADPNTESGLLVDPNIVDQYVFINDGTVSGILKYHGKTGVDPGNEPNTLYGPITLELNKLYKWAVVEAMAGFEQTFTVGSSTINDVDPNNIIGPTWQFNSINTLPVILTQPVNGRARLGTVNATAFTIEVDDDTAAYQWYKSADDVIDLEPTDFKMTSASATTDTLILGTGVNGVVIGNQGYYYCIVSNSTTQSGGGAFPDVQSNVVSFVVERKLAEYKFDNNFNDTGDVSTDLHIGTGVNSPTFVTDNVEGGYALSLNGVDQYVTLSTGAYPKAYMMDSGGAAGGLDIGSILCWVKVTQAGAILANADPNGATLLQVTANGGASITVQGLNNNYVGSAAAQSAPFYNMINDGNWHLIAATWDPDDNVDMHLYVDTTIVSVNANAPSFAPWMYNVLIGANRPNDVDYTIPGDFFGGLIDELRVYNYVVSPETIAEEYYRETSQQICIYPEFYNTGRDPDDQINPNFDNTGSSYCRIDLADFAVFAQTWLSDGFWPQ